MDTKCLENTAIHNAVLKIRNYNSLIRCGDIIRERVKRERANKLQFISSKNFAGAHPTVTSAIHGIIYHE